LVTDQIPHKFATTPSRTFLEACQCSGKLRQTRALSSHDVGKSFMPVIVAKFVSFAGDEVNISLAALTITQSNWDR
jgi:hypothetical protein